MLLYILEKLKFIWIKKYNQPVSDSSLKLSQKNDSIKLFLFDTIKWTVITLDVTYKSIKTALLLALDLVKSKNFPTAKEKSQSFLLRMINDSQGKYLWDRFRFACLRPRRRQLDLLRSILKNNEDTVFGKDYDFKNIKTLEDFRTKIPVLEYEDIRPYIERQSRGEKKVIVAEDPFLYATTSGTTGKPKFLPITKTTAKKGHSIISRSWIYKYSMDADKMFDGKILAIASPAVEGHVEDGTPFGSTSGHMYKNIPKAIKKRYVLPSFVLDISDYTTKYYIILILALREKNISYLSTANPSTIYLLCQKMNEWKEDLINDIQHGTIKSSLKLSELERNRIEDLLEPNPDRATQIKEYISTHEELRPTELWPKLSSIGCWTGGNAGNFIKSMRQYFKKDIQIRDLGYLASELRGSLPIFEGDNSGVLSILDNFFEFVEVDVWNSEENIKFKLAYELEKDKNYYIFVTNNSGLYRYNMNDIIQVTGFFLATPMIIFVQKGKGVCNITGEKLYEGQVTTAVEKTKEEMNLSLVFYFFYSNVKDKVYEMVAEFQDDINSEQEKQMLNSIETKLQKINMEYKTKRDSLRLNPIKLVKIRKGGFDAYKDKKVSEGQREGQFKMVILSGETKVRDELLNV